MLKTKTRWYGVCCFVCLVATGFFSLTWWERLHMPYNEAGRYYDGLVVWHEQAVAMYGVLAVVSWLVTVVIAVIFYKWVRNNQP